MSNHPRIVFLMQSVLTRHDVKRLGLDSLSESCEVHVLDVGALVLPQIKANRCHYPDLMPIRCHVLTSRAELDQASHVIRDSRLVINMVGSGNVPFNTLRVLRWLSAMSTPTIVISTGAIPAWSIPKKSWTLAQRLRRADPIASLLSRLPLSLLGIRPADYVLYSGSASKVRRRLVTEKTQELWGTSWDYALYRAALDDKAQPSPSDRPFALFIDQNLGFHTDIVAMGGSQPVDPETFYPQLCKLFEAVESQLGMEVVIARHPRARSEVPGDLFGGRRLVSGNTPSMLRDCSLCIVSYSTAVGLAVLFGKPLLIYSTQSIAAHPRLIGVVEAVARDVASDVVYIDADNPIELSHTMGLNDEVYRRYIKNYIKSDISTGEIFHEIIIGLVGNTKSS